MKSWVLQKWRNRNGGPSEPIPMWSDSVSLFQSNCALPGTKKGARIREKLLPKCDPLERAGWINIPYHKHPGETAMLVEHLFK